MAIGNQIKSLKHISRLLVATLKQRGEAKLEFLRMAFAGHARTVFRPIHDESACLTT
jgi:hypothetical protein